MAIEPLRQLQVTKYRPSPQGKETTAGSHWGKYGCDGNLAFPNVRYVMWKDEWEFWMPEPDESQLKHEEPVKQLLISCARDSLSPIISRLELVDRETEIVPGVRAVAAPGHTPGHMAVSVCSNGQHLLCVSDAVLHPINMDRPVWTSVYENDPEQVVNTRHELFRRADDEKALVHAFHFPWPGLGRLKRRGDAWQWQPVGIEQDGKSRADRRGRIVSP